ncbi:MAG: DUF2283 domain-containing protein [Candidatus Magasanikbacteria bacterium]
MSNKKPKISYNEDSETVSIKVKDKKSVDSDIQGNVVIDYDEEGQVVGVDIMNISLDDFEQDSRSKAKQVLKGVIN